MVDIRRIFLALALCAPAFAWGQAAFEAPNWDRTLAVQAAKAPENRAQVIELFDLLERGEVASLDQRLNAIIAGGTMPPPARDFVLFRFTVGLADYDDVDPRIVERLRSVKPSMLVPHEERASVGVPLFNIAGAAEGVYQLNLRRQARIRAEQVLDGPAQAWVDAYLLAGASQRLGFVDALNMASNEALAGILATAVPRLAVTAELTPVAGKTALLLGDAAGLEQVVRFGGGSDLGKIMEAAGQTLAADDALALLEFAVETAPAANASLAIAQLYPGLATRPEASALLFEKLGDAELGAAAALALATAGGPEIRAGLQGIALQDGTLAAARARAALGLVSTQTGQRP